MTDPLPAQRRPLAVELLLYLGGYVAVPAAVVWIVW